MTTSEQQTSSGRVAQALEIHRSIAACSDHLTRNDDVHALTAALMLPCYQAQLGRLARAMSSVEKSELMSLLIPIDVG
ncbi:hypothetical protein J7E70_33115 [Variovorax paradoxus]|nr:hypothetical protein [Variovorax paradoxus]MBT2305246.1 hypothetical protein [Variovorax paradoxus]